jgi:hypothetical protein
MKKTLTILVFLIIATGALQAGTLTYTNSAIMRTLQDATVTLTKFDTQGGIRTLTRIYIEFTTALYGTDYAFDNDLTVAKKPSVTLSADILSFASAAGLTGTGINPDGSDLAVYELHSFSLAKDNGDPAGQFDEGGTDYARWIPGDLISTIGGYVDSSVFADYIGSGTFNTTINADISAAISTWSGVEADPNNTFPSGEFSARVTYEFIPEPTAVGLIGLGGLVTLTASRIRRRNA